MDGAFSVETVSISAVAYDGYDLATTLQSIRGLGMKVVELAHIAGNSETFDERNLDRSHAEQARELLERYGLTCHCLSAHMDLSVEGGVAAMERRLAYAHMVGARYVATKSAPADRRAQLMENLAHMAVMAADLNITILLENPSAGDGDVVDDGPSGAAFLAEAGLDNVGLNYDFGNLMSRHQGRLRPETDCLPALPLSPHLHVKDVQRIDAGWGHTAIGQGDIDYRTILDEVRRMEQLPLISIELPTRMVRHVDGAPYPPLPPMPIGEIERLLVQSVACLRA